MEGYGTKNEHVRIQIVVLNNHGLSLSTDGFTGGFFGVSACT